MATREADYSVRFEWLRINGIAAVSTVVVLGTAYLVLPEGGYGRKFFFERSPIQYATIYFFWVSLWALAFRHRWIRREMAAISQLGNLVNDLPPSFRTGALRYSDVPDVRGEVLNRLTPAESKSRISHRIFGGLERLEKTQSTSETREYFNTASEVDLSDVESAFSMITYFIWLLPTLGFVGTVMGIGFGISGFAEIISGSQDMSQLREALPEVTAALGTAFDTTFLALVLSILVVWYSSWLRKRDEQLLNETDKICHDGVLPLFREYSHATKELVTEMHAVIQRTIDAGNANRILLDGTLKETSDALGKRLEGIRSGLERVGRAAETSAETGRAAADGTAHLAKGTMDALTGLAAAVEKLNVRLDGLSELLSQKPAAVSRRPARSTKPLKPDTLQPPADPDERPESGQP